MTVQQIPSAVTLWTHPLFEPLPPGHIHPELEKIHFMRDTEIFNPIHQHSAVKGRKSAHSVLRDPVRPGPVLKVHLGREVNKAARGMAIGSGVARNV